MARTALAVQAIDVDGITPSYAAANVDGNSVANTGDQFVHVKNGSASSVTVTIPTPAKVQGVDVADITVAVAAGAEAMIGPFPAGLFNQSGGVVYINYSAVTSVTVAAFKV